GSSIEATATVTFVVAEHDFDTSTWQYDDKKHWNPCKDDGCAVRGNEASHDTNGELTGYLEATFDNDGYSGDKHCSVCGAVAEEGAGIPAGKYIRESRATMEPATITDKLTANELVFTSLDTSKYTVELWRVFDLTNTDLNTEGGQYPKDSKFIAGHEYAIEFEFKAVGSYIYNETQSEYWSTFTLNGQPTDLSASVVVSGARQRRVTFTATDTTIPITVTDVQISFSDVNVQRGENYSFTANVTGTGAFDNSVIWSIEGANNSSISTDGILTVAVNESASTMTIKATSKQDSTKYATKTVTIQSFVIVSQNGVETKYKVVAGETINLTAETAESGYHFKEWQVSGAGTFTDKNAKQTGFIVPYENVTITSVYELHMASSVEWFKDSTKHYHICSCGAQVDVAPHTPNREVATETEAVKCSVCEYVITPALGHTTHTPGEEWFSDGVNHWHKCTGCSEKFDIALHTFGNWTVTIEPQVGVVGEKERECSVCRYKEIASIDALSEKIIVSVVGGNVNGDTNVTVDRNGVVTVVANEAPRGKTFKGWSIDGGQTIISESTSYTFNATDNVTLTAVYDDIENTGLSAGAIVGIVVGVVVVVGLGGFSVFWFVIRRKKFSDLITIFKKK
ncbi:MAG: hypothetical protein ACI4TX_00365, partial [Christensenellales bacterium]